MTPFSRLSRLAPALALALSTAVPVAPGPAIAAGGSAAAASVRATRVTLANGLRVVLAPDSQASAVDAALWIRSGSRHESTARTGLALLCARLTFRNGSADPLAPLAAEGGTGAIAVTPDFTSFSTTVPAEGLHVALAFLAERLPGKPVAPAELAAERAAFHAERSRPERTPVVRALGRLWNTAWAGHPYARTGGTPPATSDATTVATVDAWRRERFQPGNAVLTIAGSFDPERALADVRARFERLPRGTTAGASASRAVAARGPARASERMELPARLCLVGWRGPGAADPDAPALELLATWLGNGSQARLHTSLVHDWGLAITTQAGFLPQQDGSLLWTLAVVPPDADSAAVERTLLDAAKGITQRAPEAFELERARRQLESAVWFGLQTARQRGQALGEAEMLAGDAAAASRRLEALSQVTPEDLRRVAMRVMTDAGRATVWMLPSSAGAAR